MHFYESQFLPFDRFLQLKTESKNLDHPESSPEF